MRAISTKGRGDEGCSAEGGPRRYRLGEPRRSDEGESRVQMAAAKKGRGTVTPLLR